MLVETINELSKSPETPEITITNLKLEIEKLKHKHEEELAEIKKNVTNILEDLQKSFKEEKQRIVNETKATCESDAVRRVHEAKSRQWQVCFFFSLT